MTLARRPLSPDARNEVLDLATGVGRSRSRRDDPEHREQVAVVQWAETWANRWPELASLYAVPNGGQRHPAVAAKLRDEGVKPGVPDLCLPVARGGFHALYVEMKADGGRPTANQKGWHALLRAQGNAVVVCYSAAEAIGALLQYLGGELLAPVDLPNAA